MAIFNPGPRRQEHVGLYLGDGRMVNAPYTGTDVRVDPINRPAFVGTTRPDHATAGSM